MIFVKKKSNLLDRLLRTLASNHLPLIDVVDCWQISEKGNYVEGIAGHIITNVTADMLDSFHYDISLTFIDISYLTEVFKSKYKFQTHNFSTLCSIKLVFRSI